MSSRAAMQKSSFFGSFLAPLTGADQLAREKARLEAFLNAFPGEYCGFHTDGSVAYSEGFCALLGVYHVRKIEDVQEALKPSDAAVLEGLFFRLEKEGKAFSVNVVVEKTGKAVRLRGRTGAALDGSDRFLILWLDDVSEEAQILSQRNDAKEKAIREHALKKTALEHLPYAAWIRDGNGDLVFVNKAYAQLVGALPEEILGSQLEINITQKAPAPSLKEMAKKALSEGTEQKFRQHIIVSGKRRWLEISEQPLSGMNHTLGLAQDISHLEDMESRFNRTLAANKALLQQLQSAIAIFNSDYSLEFYNNAYASQWGLEETWLNQKPKLGDILEKLRADRRLPEQADFRKYKQEWLDRFTKLIDPHEEMMYLPDGSAVRLLLIPHPAGGLMMIFEDVSSRLELESSYNTLIAVQKETLDNLSEGVVVYGGDGRIRLWNPAFVSLCKLHPEDLEGQPHINRLAERMAAAFDPEMRDNIKTAFISHALSRSELKGTLRHTDNVHLQYATMPLPDGGVVISYYDITASAQVEQALREKNTALEAAEQLKTDFLANISYQFRTPLNAIMGFAEILEHQYFGLLNERQKEYSSGIYEAGQRLMSLVDDILDLTTIEAGYMALDKKPVEIQPLLQGLHDLTIDWARKRNLSMKLSCPALGSFILDEKRIKQALLNLIRNAINYTPEGGKIHLSAKKDGLLLILVVEDNGIGISPENLNKIFQPFERVTSSQKNTGNTGAGLGLTLVKNIVELHGGTVRIESIEGKGTSIRLELKEEA
jgi:PAS domain S-box-containing protein